MIRRYQTVRMTTSDQEWVREYLGYDAATNDHSLQTADHWIVVDYGALEDVEIEYCTGHDAEPTGEGFLMEDVSYDEVIRSLRTEGFPRGLFVE